MLRPDTPDRGVPLSIFRRRWFPWAIFGTWVASLGPLAVVLYVISPKPGDHGYNCGGIGFGEVPCGWDAVGFTFIFLGIPYGAIYAVVLAASEVLGERFTIGRAILAFVGASIPWVLAALAAISG